MNPSGMPIEVQNYLARIQRLLQDKLLNRLEALYLGGSVGLQDFNEGSDLDITVLVTDPMTENDKIALAQGLSHHQLPSPVLGLDLIAYRLSEVNPVQRAPRYEFSIATGRQWTDEVEYGGEYAGGIIDLAILKESGVNLTGPAPTALIGQIEPSWIHAELLKTLAWHQKHIHDPFHDPTGANAVLNACRALVYFQNGHFSSKSGGAHVAQEVIPQFAGLINEALEMRSGSPERQLGRDLILEFLGSVAKHCKAKLHG